MLGTKLLLLIIPTSRIFACKGTPSSQSDIDGLFFLLLLVDSMPIFWSESVDNQDRAGFWEIPICCFRGETYSVSDFTKTELLLP